MTAEQRIRQIGELQRELAESRARVEALRVRIDEEERAEARTREELVEWREHAGRAMAEADLHAGRAGRFESTLREIRAHGDAWSQRAAKEAMGEAP